MVVLERSAHADTTIAALWRGRLLGTRHWRTKAAYYRAVIEVVESSPSEPLTWRSIVETVRPRGSRTTFYEVTGSHARHALVKEFAASDHVDALQLALRYQRPTAVEQLIDETKVWSFWLYRDRWLNREEDGAGAESLVSSLAQWAWKNPRLAAALDYAPPASAVEDLLRVHDSQLSPPRAYAILALEIRRALARSKHTTAV